ncbi:hypothetical protein JFN88_10715 [Paenibacillus sp. MAHUQ-46]|uniref:Uncharacterized protein n=2 Tax=Paenibacillus TaxID=44249 RepID=A0A934J1V1_9BACL|nr:hypothetical protein [Paenibacillus roseus]
MNKTIKYSLFFIILIIIILGSIYFIKQFKCPELLVKKTIERSIQGKFNDLELSEENKNTLRSFFNNNELLSDRIHSSIRLINKINKVSNYLVSIEQINYTDAGDVLDIIDGNLLIQIDHSSIFQCHILNVEIQKNIE